MGYYEDHNASATLQVATELKWLGQNLRVYKRFRSAIDESLDEFLCPITHSLPLEPVLAEDGKVYERSAIECHGPFPCRARSELCAVWVPVREVACRLPF